MDLNLTNRTAIVTGGATGLGREFVLSLAKEGVNICFTYMREEEHPERLIETVKASANVEIIAVKTDLSDEQSRENLFATCIDRLGKADILVNNADLAERLRHRDQPAGLGSGDECQSESHLPSQPAVCKSLPAA